jgi:type IV pilus assembly protein PilQ
MAVLVKNALRMWGLVLAVLLVSNSVMFAQDDSNVVTTLEVATPAAEVNAVAAVAVEVTPVADVNDVNAAATGSVVIVDQTGQPPQGKVLTPLEKKMSKIISANYDDAPIGAVLNQLSRQGDINIIVSPDVQGNVTVSLIDVPLYEALTNILAAHNFGYIATENMIRVVPLSQISVESQKLVDAVFRVKYANVKDVAVALEKFISQNGEIAVNPGTRNILVMDTEQKIAAIEKFITEIDRITPQVLIEARIYDISSRDNLDLGVKWGMATTSTISGDAPGSITNPDGTTRVDGGRLEPFSGGTFDSTVNKTSTDNAFRFGILNDSVDLDAILKAGQEDIDATLLANPRVLVLDNEQAIFKSITEIPYQELQETSAGGSIGTIEFKEVGVQLTVTPNIIEGDNSIRMRIQPEFSVATGQVNVGGYEVQSEIITQPVVETRKADTTLIVNSNETVVLGGLRKKEISMQKNKVPLLGDLPLLGGLFRFEAESTTNSELVLFVTPTIIRKPVMTIDEIDQHSLTELSAIKKYKTGKVDRMKDASPNEAPKVE